MNENTRPTILQAAVDLIDAEGIDAVTIRSVADAALVGRSTVTHHFTDKAGLLDAVHLVGVELFFSAIVRVRSVRDDSLWEVLNIDEIEPEAISITGQEVIQQLEERHPGLWELLLANRCPAFDASDCPTTVAVLDANFRGGLSDHRGRTWDMIWKQTATVWEWKKTLPGREYERITAQSLDLPYYTGLFGLDT